MYGAGDVRVEQVARPVRQPADAILRVVMTATVIGDGAPGLSVVLASGCLGAERIILMGRHPGRVFDRTTTLDDVPAGYAEMDTREVLKVLDAP